MNTVLSIQFIIERPHSYMLSGNKGRGVGNGKGSRPPGNSGMEMLFFMLRIKYCQEIFIKTDLNPPSLYW